MPSHENPPASIPKPIRHAFPGPGEGRPSEARVHRKIAAVYLIWIIERKPVTGYELMKMLREDPHHPMANASRIYPFLSSLEKKGLLRSRILKKGKRESKQYSITPKGKLVVSTTRKLLSRMLWGEFLQDISRRR
jgi:DNA-binding PadR family transcriptional regulator